MVCVCVCVYCVEKGEGEAIVMNGLWGDRVEPGLGEDVG